MRKTTRGLKVGVAIYVRGATSRRNARGRIVSIKGDMVEYRSSYNGCTYLVLLGRCRLDREIERRRRALAAAEPVED
jgi:hypothetical protein